MWRLKVLRKSSKFLLGATIVALIASLIYDSSTPTKDLITAKLAVKQLENSDASYLAFAHSSDISTWLYMVTGALMIITGIIIYRELKGE